MQRDGQAQERAQAKLERNRRWFERRISTFLVRGGERTRSGGERTLPLTPPAPDAKVLTSSKLRSSVRNDRSPSRHWRLTFRVGDDQLATWSQKKKKKKRNLIEQSSSRESFAKKAGRSGASILRFDRERNTDRETPTCHA